MPTLDKLVQGAKGLKVKEVPTYVAKFAGEHYTPEKTMSRLGNWMQNYRTQVRNDKCATERAQLLIPYRPHRLCPPARPQYIDTGSVKPLFDLVGYGFLFSYAISWPREYAHYKHEQEAKLKGGH
jgi:hypothetical protein